jgi:hypothetical protein
MLGDFPIGETDRIELSDDKRRQNRQANSPVLQHGSSSFCVKGGDSAGCRKSNMPDRLLSMLNRGPAPPALAGWRNVGA